MTVYGTAHEDVEVAVGELLDLGHRIIPADGIVVLQTVVFDQQGVVVLDKLGFADQRPGPDGDGGDRRRSAEEQRIDRDGLGGQRLERKEVLTPFYRTVEAHQRIIPGPGELDPIPANTGHFQAGPAACGQLITQGEAPLGAGFGGGEAIFDTVAGIAAEIFQDAAAERASVARLAPHPAVVDQSVVVAADRRFERVVIATVTDGRSGGVHGLHLGIIVVTTHPDHIVEQNVLRQVGVVDALRTDQYAKTVEHMVGDIDIDPVFPFQFETVGNPGHLRIDPPRMVARFVKDVRNGVGTAVEAGHDGEVHTPPARQLPDVGDARILLRIGPPRPEGVDVVGVVEQSVGNRRLCGGNGGKEHTHRQQ